MVYLFVSVLSVIWCGRGPDRWVRPVLLVLLVATMDKLLDVEKLFRVEDASELPDWNIPLSFMKSRHLELIEGLEEEGTSWRIKDRVSLLQRREGGKEGGRCIACSPSCTAYHCT